MKGLPTYFLILFSTLGVFAQKPYKRALKLMGSRFDITVVAENQEKADTYADLAIAEITRIERMISSWDPGSQTSAINRQAGIKPVQVNTELFDLINRSLHISQLTDGAFDITYASMDHIWKFDGSMNDMPEAEDITASVSLVGYQKIVLDPDQHTVFLPEKGMKIGFGAIGKGYAADKARAILKQQGVPSGIINASGDLTAWGYQPGGKPWKVAITNPMDKTKSFGLLDIQEKAVVTSGDYEKYITLDGVRYSHIIDPRTGYPAKGILSATVFAPKAELADALATAVFVMGVETGIDRINQLPGIECIIVDDKGNLHKSAHLEIQSP